MWMRFGLLLVGSSLVSAAVGSSARPANAASPMAAAQVGSLQRTAAALDDCLDVYRLALVELVPALRRILAQGQQPGALPTTPLPEVAAEVLRRLAASVPRRVAATALPALPRAYHAEVLQALDNLAAAHTLGEVAAPVQALHAAMAQVATLGDDVVDVFSRQRPLLDDIPDDGEVLDNIREGLDQLALAEANIRSVRDRRGVQGEQLQAFLRLEIALGHVLDLIAAAEESGVHIGFELQHSTVGLAARLRLVSQHLKELQHTSTDLSREPRAVGYNLHVELLEHGPRGSQAQLAWTPLEATLPGVSLVRVYRRLDKAGLVQQLASALRCDGHDIASATQIARQQVADLADSATPFLDVKPTSGTAVDTFADKPIAPPWYGLATVSPFGVESRSVERLAVPLPTKLVAPQCVEARPQAPTPEMPEFYRDADAVVINWQPSLNDLTDPSPARAFAEEHRLPVLARYEIFRLQPGAAPERVGHVPPGITRWVDRPPQDALRMGVAYAVEAVDAQGEVARGAGACAQSPNVSLDVQDALLEAQSGAAHLIRPTHFEAQRAELLANSDQGAAARAAFLHRDPNDKRHLLALFWNDASAKRRLNWRSGWVSYMDEEERTRWLAAAPESLQPADLAEAEAEIWLSENPQAAPEVERLWDLNDETTQRAAVQAWLARQSQAYSAWINDRLQHADANQRREMERPARVWTWWQSRDAEELQQVHAAWLARPAEEQRRRLREWLHTQPRVAQMVRRWPDWEKLTPESREEWLKAGYQQLPSGLWPVFLAWLQWYELSPASKADVIVQEVGWYNHLSSIIKFLTRPLDLWLDFKLTLALLVACMGVVSGFVLQYAARQQADDD